MELLNRLIKQEKEGFILATDALELVAKIKNSSLVVVCLYLFKHELEQNVLSYKRDSCGVFRPCKYRYKPNPLEHIMDLISSSSNHTSLHLSEIVDIDSSEFGDIFLKVSDLYSSNIIKELHLDWVFLARSISLYLELYGYDLDKNSKYNEIKIFTKKDLSNLFKSLLPTHIGNNISIHKEIDVFMDIIPLFFQQDEVSLLVVKTFCFNNNIIINGFNDDLKVNNTSKTPKSTGIESQTKIDALQEELTKAKERIKQLEAQKDPLEIQTNKKEIKPSTREENNIIRVLAVLAVLAEMERKIDISKPYEAHGVMLKKAQLLGIDSFPSSESIKKWFYKANEYKNPN